MEFYRHFGEVPGNTAGCVLTIGSFDGLHLGHQLLLQQVKRQSQSRGLLAGIMTFSPHPAKLLAPKLSPPLLMSEARKENAFRQLGFDFCLVQRFDRQFSEFSDREFASQVLSSGLRAQEVIIGDDFTFGHKRAGGVAELAELGKVCGFSVNQVDRLTVESIIVSSTRIRSFLLQGKVRGAALLLGRPFVVSGKVVSGQGRGRNMGFPTANLETNSEILPARGVYLCHCWLPGEETGRLAVANIGSCPTFGSNLQSLEVHIPNYSGDLRGQRLVVGFLCRLREERVFPSAEALAGQIEADLTAAQDNYSSYPPDVKLDPLDGLT